METFTITFDGIELEAHEIRVEGVDIMDLLSHHTVLCIEHEVVEKYELA